MTSFHIVGAGLAGLLAGCILRDECAAIHERQDALPNNHLALLRFRSSVVGDALNIPFRKVVVLKSIYGASSSVAAAIGYSLKTNGTATLRSLVGFEEISERYIAPSNLVTLMANKVQSQIRYGSNFAEASEAGLPIISTMPMNALAELLGYKDLPEFRFSHGWVTRVKLRNCDVYSTIYLPRAEDEAYRASITGDELIIEYAFPGKTEEAAAKLMEKFSLYPKSMYDHLQMTLQHFGMNNTMLIGKPSCKPQRFAKILPIEDDARKRFMLWATEKHNVFSFGRYATWRPGLLLDDLVQDLKVIQAITRKGTYDHRK